MGTVIEVKFSIGTFHRDNYGSMKSNTKEMIKFCIFTKYFKRLLVLVGKYLLKLNHIYRFQLARNIMATKYYNTIT